MKRRKPRPIGSSTHLGLAEDRINDICYGIAIHVDGKADFPGERTPFALSIGAADNIDRFDVFRIHETLTHDGFSFMGIDQKLEYCKKHLARLHKLIDEPMGTKTADEMWKARLSFQISFYGKLVRQFESSERVQ